jgi:tyrosyl-tRNA synthetase
MMTVYDEFQWRGMVYGATEGAPELLAREPVTCYAGFDPTASSLHVGSLLPIMALARMQRFGHTPIAIVGGGTGLIGDPSGKSQERALLSRDEVTHNLEAIRGQLARFLDFEGTANRAHIVNNAEWLDALGLMAFLRDVGKHFTVNYMLAKEAVKRRVESEDGLSFTEFSYLMLQAYDFLMLYDRYQGRLQLGGSDQWGNIVAGCDLIRKLRGGQAFGLVVPLVTTASGTKFGKTETGTVWLDPERTSPYRFHQFWLNADDRDAVTYLKHFTFLPREEIAGLEAATREAPAKREAQRRLAHEVDCTRPRRRRGAGGRAWRLGALRSGRGEVSGRRNSGRRRGRALGEVPAVPRLTGGLPLVELLAATGVASSRAKRCASSAAASTSQRTDHRRRCGRWNARSRGRLILLRKGQKQNLLVRVVSGLSVAAHPARQTLVSFTAEFIRGASRPGRSNPLLYRVCGDPPAWRTWRALASYPGLPEQSHVADRYRDLVDALPGTPPEARAPGVRLAAGHLSATRVLALSLVVLACAARLVTLDADPDYYGWITHMYDEGRWVEHARSLAQQGRLLEGGDYYHLMLGSLFQLASYISFVGLGVSRIAARLFPAICGGILIAFLWSVLRRSAGELGALAGVAIVAFQADMVVFSRLALPYIPAVLIQLLVLAVLTARAPSWKRCLAAGVLATLGTGFGVLGFYFLPIGAMLALAPIPTPVSGDV